MRLRVAKKIVRAALRAPLRHTRDQVRRACVRSFASPLQVSSRDPIVPGIDAIAMGGRFRRILAISMRLVILEQPRRLFDVVRRNDGRLQLRPRES